MSSAANHLKPCRFLGLDFGSRFVKLVYTADGHRFRHRKLDSLVFFRDLLTLEKGQRRIQWAALGLTPPERVVLTGYGKNLFTGQLPTITEIRAHFLGALWQSGLQEFILLEIGGQDSKALYIRDGRVFDFLTNDKCAAGTGRYLENMARFLKMPLATFAACWEDPVAISNTCAIFGETELISHLLNGISLARLAAGVNDSVARRALAMIRRFPSRTLVFVGGVARNQAVVKCLQRRGDYHIIVPPAPQYNGALGCCLEALQAAPVNPAIPG